MTERILHVLLLASVASAPDTDWSRFRGPNGSGVSATTGLPAEFGPEKNVVWKTELPQGFSSPVIYDNRIFLTAHKDASLLTIAIDRSTGHVLWQQSVPRRRQETLHKKNHPAAASAATDGRHVVVFFGDYGLVTYDVNGRELWKQPLGPFNNVYGMGASPVIVDDKVILACDQSLNSFIAAYDKRTGRLLWRHARPEAKSGHSTPIVWTPAGGRTQIVLPGSFRLSGYDAATGRRVWWVDGLSFEMKSTPVVNGDTLYINGFGSPENNPGSKVTVMPTDEAFAKRDGNGDGKLSAEELPTDHARNYLSFMDLDGDKAMSRPEWDYYKAAMASDNGMLAIRLGGSGDMTPKSVRWKTHRGIPQLPSPLIYRNVLYMVNDAGGIVTMLDPESGEQLLQGRLPGSSDSFYASPVAGDGKVYIASEKGRVFVLPPGPTLEPIAVNDLQDNIYATPALVDGRIYLRTLNTLYCFGST